MMTLNYSYQTARLGPLYPPGCCTLRSGVSAEAGHSVLDRTLGNVFACIRNGFVPLMNTW